MSKGAFIVFSGGEGSGKSTILRILKEEFPHIVATREPGGTPWGEALRQPLLDPALTPSPWAELFLFMSIRAQHVAELIAPKLSAGQVVITDRYLEDTFAYQWSTRIGESSPEVLLQLAAHAGFTVPDAWVWFDVDPAEGLRRRRNTGEINRIDAETVEFHTQVHQAFKRLMTFAPYTRIGHRIDANQPLGQVYADVKATLKPLLATGISRE